MSRRVLLSNLHLLTVESLEGVPWLLAKEIWKAVQVSDLESLHVLQTFLIVYKDEPDFNFITRKRTKFSGYQWTQGGIPAILKFGVAPNFEWITNLYLKNYMGDRPELIKISKIRNLGAVHIDGPSMYDGPDDLPDWAPMDDRVVKAWVEDANENGLLSKLRLFTFSRLEGVTNRSLSLLRELPAVEFCNVSDCGLKNLLCIGGWKRLTRAQTERTISSHLFFDSQSGRALSTISYLHEAILDACNPEARWRCTDHTASLPVLGFHNQSRGLELDPDSWFQRLTGPTPSQPQPPVKRKTEAPSQPGPQKRKLRANKTEDLGKLLGDFGVGNQDSPPAAPP